jgi:hypothetical protein
MRFKNAFMVLVFVAFLADSKAHSAPISNGNMKDVAVVGGVATWLLGYVVQEDFFATMQSVNKNSAYVGVSYGKNEAVKFGGVVFGRSLVSKIIDKSSWNLGAQWELSLDYWQSAKDELEPIGFVARIMPVYRYEFNTANLKPYLKQNLKPYAEVSIGLALLSSTSIGNTEKSTHLHFAEYLGFGLDLASYRVGYRFMHISNGSLVLPNRATDVHSLVVGKVF